MKMETRRDNLYFGGSFNPIHHGHLLAARAVAERENYSRVILIPSSQPPHKPKTADLAEARHRLEMCRLAIAGEDQFGVDDLELARTGPSYTIHTARQLAQRAPAGSGSGGVRKAHWLIGADMLNSLPSWHEPQALLREVHFVILTRPGWSLDWASMPPEYRHLADQVVTGPLMTLSGTEIRRRVSTGQSIAYFTPPAVCEYIRQNRLYTTQPSE